MPHVLVQPTAATMRRLTTALQDVLSASHQLADFSCEGEWLGGSIEANNTTVYSPEYRSIIAKAHSAAALIRDAESEAFMLGITLYGTDGIPENPRCPLS